MAPATPVAAQQSQAQTPSQRQDPCGQVRMPQRFNIGDSNLNSLSQTTQYPAYGGFLRTDRMYDQEPMTDYSVARPQSNKWDIFWKTSKELKAFDGKVENYDEWHARIVEHCALSNQSWLKVFDLIEKTKRPVSLRDLPNIKIEGLDVDWNNLAVKLWTFIGNHVTGIIHQRRNQLTLGQEYNGIELWRALFVQNKGGAEQVAVGGISAFHAFPVCRRVEDLQYHIGEWQVMKMKHGAGIDDQNLKSMLLNTHCPRSQRLRFVAGPS